MDQTIRSGRFDVESESGGMGLEAVNGQTVEDVRVRVARRKRERMRKRLLSAALSIFLRDRGGSAAIAEDVIKAAGVSRGTFYKYFNSVEEAADEVGQQLADEAVRELIRAVPGRERSPIERAALG